MKPGRISRKSKRRCPSGKRRYRDRQEAKQMVATFRANVEDGLSQRTKVQCRVYFCRDCKGWHMTSREERDPRCKHGFDPKTCTWYSCIVARGGFHPMAPAC